MFFKNICLFAILACGVSSVTFGMEVEEMDTTPAYPTRPNTHNPLFGNADATGHLLKFLESGDILNLTLVSKQVNDSVKTNQKQLEDAKRMFHEIFHNPTSTYTYLEDERDFSGRRTGKRVKRTETRNHILERLLKLDSHNGVHLFFYGLEKYGYDAMFNNAAECKEFYNFLTGQLRNSQDVLYLWQKQITDEKSSALIPHTLRHLEKADLELERRLLDLDVLAYKKEPAFPEFHQSYFARTHQSYHKSLLQNQKNPM